MLVIASGLGDNPDAARRRLAWFSASSRRPRPDGRRADKAMMFLRVLRLPLAVFLCVVLLVSLLRVATAQSANQASLGGKVSWKGSGVDSSNQPVWIFEVRVRLTDEHGDPQARQLLTFLTPNCRFPDSGSEDMSDVTDDRGWANVLVYCAPGVVGMVTASFSLAKFTTPLKKPSWLARKKWWLLGAVALAVTVCAVGCGDDSTGQTTTTRPSVTITGPTGGPAGPP